MFDGRLRSQVDAAVKPIGNSIRKSGVSADAITTVGIVMAFAAAAAIASGALRLGFLLLILTGIPDLLDGAVAKASGKSTLRGAFFDSVSDRLTDGLLFGGIAYYLAASGEAPWVVMLPVAGYVTASIVSYIRAKADALGFDARGGLVERAERFILLAIGLLFEPILLVVLGLIILLNTITAGQRFVKVWKQASAEAPVLSDRRRRRARRSGRSGQGWQRSTARARQGRTRRPGA